jgi:hypothetical protein
MPCWGPAPLCFLPHRPAAKILNRCLIPPWGPSYEKAAPRLSEPRRISSSHTAIFHVVLLPATIAIGSLCCCQENGEACVIAVILNSFVIDHGDVQDP